MNAVKVLHSIYSKVGKLSSVHKGLFFIPTPKNSNAKECSNYSKVVAEWLDAGFLASGGDEFNPGPETRLDRSELLCNKVLLKYKGDREGFSHRHHKGAKEYPPPSLYLYVI